MKMMTWKKQGYSFYSMIIVFSLLTMTACSGGGSGSGSPPPFIFAVLSSFPTGSIPAGFTTGASVQIQDASSGANITNATVTMNGTPLQYSLVSQDYVGDVVVAPGSTVTVTATVGSYTYSASGNQFSSYPTLSSPVSNSSWTASNPIPVSWAGGLPTQNAIAYGIGVLDVNNPDGALAWPRGFDIKPESIFTFSDTIPANSLALGNYFMIACIVGNAVAIPNATADSILAFAGCNYVPTMVGEAHITPLFGTFTLDSSNIDVTMIDIKVMSDTGAFIDLVDNVHYVVQPTGNMVMITIVSLPPAIIAEGHSLSYAYTFRASYGLL
jgi:hypothetical protein